VKHSIGCNVYPIGDEEGELLAQRLCRSGPALLATVFLLALTAAHGLAQEEPSVVITAPAEGEVLVGPDITVSIALSGFTISLPLEPKREPNKGHIVYFLDVEPFFDSPTPLGEDSMIHSGRLSETFVGVADGDHTIYVCLVYDDNTCIDPALTDSVRVSVGEPLPPATPSPVATPTREPTQETPTPPPPTPTPTEEPPPLETPAQTETPPVSPTPTPPKPRPTVQPPTTVPLTPAGTPVPGMAPDTANGRETNFAVRWYAGVAGIVALIAVGALALWWVEKNRSKL
jgi:hypothetical protein